MENKKTQHKNTGHFLAFGEAYFAKHQTKLLFFLNAPILKYLARFIFSIHSEDCAYETPIEYIGTNRFTINAGLRFFKKSSLLKTDFENPEQPRYIRRIAKKLYIKIKKGTLEDKEVLLPAKRTDFRTHPKYSKRLYYAFKPMWWAMHYWDEFFADKYAPAYSFGFLTLTEYPAAGENTPVDGYVSNDRATWAAARSNTDGTTVNDTIEQGVIVQDRYISSSQWIVNVAFFLFDTSDLTASANISDTVFSVKPHDSAGSTNTDGMNIRIVASTPAATNILATGDFDQVGATSFAEMAAWTASDNTYRDFTLDANGRANVSKTGISKFGARGSLAMDNTTPTGNNQSYCRYADYTGTTSDPKLVVTYTTSTAYTKDLTETVTLVQTQIKAPAKQIEETVTLAEVFTKVATMFRALTETVTLVASSASSFIYTRAFSETVTLAETLGKIPGKILTETITLVETFARAGVFFRSLTDTVVLVAVSAQAKAAVRSLTETITLVETQVRQTGKYILEAITLNAVLATARGYVRAFTDTVVLVASSATFRTHIRALTETITLVATIKRTTSKVFTETVSLVLRFLGLHNGKDISYRNKYEDRSGTYRNKYRQF